MWHMCKEHKENGYMKEGRPTKLTQEVLEQTRAYILSCEDIEKEVNLPTIEGLAYEIKVNKDTIYTWRKGEEEIHIEFSDLITDLLAKQAKQLVNKGLAGTYNATIAKVLLTKHGYREGIETDLTTLGEKLETSSEIKELTKQLNEIHRGTSEPSDGGATSSLGDEI